ncbi:MAG: hypothetical protein ABI656_11670 [bacterium]
MSRRPDPRRPRPLELTRPYHASASTDADRAGLQRAAIDRKVRALKLKDLLARGEDVETGATVLPATEYPALLSRVYKDDKFAKPRNLLGRQKGLPVAEMEKAIIAHTVIGDDDLNTLCNRRAETMKDWLLQTGGVEGERMFIVAAKPGAQEAGGKDNGLAPSRVDFSLR